MKHEALTISDDQKRLLDGAVAAGEFSSRSAAIRLVLRAYFTDDIERTAALVATSDDVDFESVVNVLDVDVEEFAKRVRELNVDAVPERLNAHIEREDVGSSFGSVLQDIEAEVRAPETPSEDDGGDDE
ncbi:hypothetical protein [Haloferax sp. DFSO52]|uniref:hypothetical protein n=1 Tax=Haloferax sp. DFSO52 TaxID=3388505 RepID=UPI003A8606BF